LTGDSDSAPIRALELFAGIGGFSAAMGHRVSIVAAVDINREAIDVYRHNFAHPSVVATVESLSLHQLRKWDADLWWMSPPCQPFTSRGKGLDIRDPRTSGLLHLIDCLAEVGPEHLGLENVPDFFGSKSYELLRSRLADLGYEVFETLLCPSGLGSPNRRRRYYLVASRSKLEAVPETRRRRFAVRDILDPRPDDSLWIDPDLALAYPHALNIVDPADPEAVTSCFTSAYGRSPVRSGSYLRTKRGLRRFSPQEILRLLGFPESFSIPPHVPLSTAWRLVGNSLSLPAVRQTMQRIPGLPRSHPIDLEPTAAVG